MNEEKDNKDKPSKPGKVRAPFRRNRSKPSRDKNWTQKARDDEGETLNTFDSESVRAKGSLSRNRTIKVHQTGDEEDSALRAGVVVAMRGLYAEVDDGERVWLCTIRKVLRSRQIDERHAVTIGDRVGFTLETSGSGEAEEGVIEQVKERHGQLRRKAGRRIQTIAANVDQAIIVSSAAQPSPKPQLIDRYIVAALAGDVVPIICFNKIDLDEGHSIDSLLQRYTSLGYQAIGASTVTGVGIDQLRQFLKDKSSVVAGQSGVGKSSLLNAIQPGLKLKTGSVAIQTEKGRHTTTTASLIRLDQGGYVVDTPGIRSFDISMIPKCEIESYFEEFVKHIEDCKFPDCTHTHETKCAVKSAVENGEIDVERYESYVYLFEDPDR